MPSAGISLAEITLFHFVAGGMVVFIAAWLTFHLLAVNFTRYHQLHSEGEFNQAAAQLNSLLQQQTATVEAMVHDPNLARLLLDGSAGQLLEERQVELGALFPMALRVMLLRPIGAGLEIGAFPRLNAADLGLLERSGAQHSPLPLEVHAPGADAQHIDIVRPIRVADQEIVGYLLVTFGQPFLQHLLDQVAGSGGYLEIRQTTGVGQDVILAMRGDTSLQNGTAPWSAPLPGTQWQLAFWPAAGSTDPVALDARLFWSIFAGALLLLALFAYLFSKTITRLVRNDLNTLVAVAREGRKSDNHRVSLHNFQSAMDALGNIIKAALAIPREKALVARTPEAGAMPWDIDDVMQLFQKEKPVAALNKQRKDNVMIPSSIFRAYDIRGVVGDTLTADIVYELGRAIGSEAYARGQQTVIVARDGRLSGPEFVQALSNGLRASGRDVIDVGRVPTPVLYFATHYLSSSSGVMVTGSHNPPNYNGFKMVLRGETLAEAAIQRLRSRLETGELISGGGSYRVADVVPDYIERITSDVQLARPLKVVVDCGNGVAGEIAPRLLRLLGCEVIELFCEIDGNFPNHHPDPSQPENVADLINAVARHKADVGLAFDGDGDRLGVISSQGEIIWADRQMMLYAKDVLSRNPGAEIIFDIKCSTHLARVITENGGRPLMWKTGHSLVKAKMKETGALLAGEMSGHIFFKERWYGFDDALYTAVRLLEILARDPRNSSEVFAELPNAISTPELKIEVQEGEQQPFVARLLERARFADAEITTIDGLRADFKDGWGLVRASNTTPSLVLRFEADNTVALQRIQEQFRAILMEMNPELVLPF